MCQQRTKSLIQASVMFYTTVSGVDGFDGTRKAPKAVVKAIV
jgi:hypothetical protein